MSIPIVKRPVRRDILIQTDQGEFEYALESKDCKSTLNDKSTILVPYAYGRDVLGTAPTPIVQGTPVPFTVRLRDEQLGPAMTLLARVRQCGYALLSLGCGGGKTALANWLRHKLQPMRTLIIVPSLVLRGQWSDEIKTFSGDEPWIATNPEAVGIGARAVVCLIHVVDRLPPWFLSTIDLLIVDECHTGYGKEHCTSLLKCNPKAIVGLSATPDTIAGKQNKVVALTYGVRAIHSATLSPFKVARILLPFKPRIVKKWINGKMRDDWSTVCNSLSFHAARNKFIIDLALLYSRNPENRVLVLCKRVAHITEHLIPLLKEKRLVRGTDYEGMYGGTRGVTDRMKVLGQKRKRGMELKYRLTPLSIGTFDTVGVGFDEKSCDGYDGHRINVVILAADVIDPRQAAGRGFRSKKPLIIELLDDYSLIREKHAGIRYAWWDEHGAESIVTLDMAELALE